MRTRAPACRGIEAYRKMFIKDPVRIENRESYRRLREQTAVPIAAGEQLGTKWQFRSLIEEELIDYAMANRQTNFLSVTVTISS